MISKVAYIATMFFTKNDEPKRKSNGTIYTIEKFKP